jgi:hypothetical protein
MEVNPNIPMQQPPKEPCWRSEGRFIVGVDLGQSSDPTAVCVLHSLC